MAMAVAFQALPVSQPKNICRCGYGNPDPNSKTFEMFSVSPRARIGVHAQAGKKDGRKGGIGSGRRRRGGQRVDKVQSKEHVVPFLEPQMRRFEEEGHRVLGDVEYLLLRAENPFGLVLEIAEEANEFMRNNKDASLRRRPVLKAISDRINYDAGHQVTDSYLEGHPNYEAYEADALGRSESE